MLGFLGHLAAKTGENLVSAAEHAPGGVMAISGAGAHDFNKAIESIPGVGHLLAEPLVGKSAGDKGGYELPAVAKQVAQQTKTDLTHPLRNPGNTLLDALGVLSAGAGTVGRLGAAGDALAGADKASMLDRLSGAGKALVTKPAPVTRLISHDGVSVKLPAADNPLTRTVQAGIDHLRERFPNVPLVGAARTVGKEINRGLRFETQRAKAPIDTMNALAGKAGMLKRTATGRLTGDALARQHSLRVVAEGVPTEERIAYHENALAKGYKSVAQNPAIRAMRESTFNSGHEEQIALNRAAQKYLDENGTTPKLADPKLQAVYDQMRKVAGNREAIISQLGKLKDETMAGRVNAPARLFRGEDTVDLPEGGKAVRVPGDVPEAQLSREIEQSETVLRGEQAKLATLEKQFASQKRPGPVMKARVAAQRESVAEWEQKVADAHAAYADHGPTIVPASEGPGEMRIPTQPADKAAVKAMQATPSYAGGEINAPGSLRHAYSGAAYAGGKIRNDVVRLMSESALEAQRYWTLLHVGDKLKDAAKDVPTSEHDVPIVTQHLPGRPSLAKAKAMLADESKFEPGMAELSHGYEGLREALFPSKEEAAAEPIPGVKWIDERLLGGLNKPNPLGALMQYSSAQKAVGTLDAINNASKLAILYLKPAYIAPNLLSNLAMNFVQQGFAAPANLARAARLWANADPETINEVLSSMGGGVVSALDSDAGRGARAVHALASKFAKPVDVLPRLASFLYEARRDGVSSVDNLRSLFADPAQGDKLDQITRRANAAMIDFGNLTPIERTIIRRVIFFYPWAKGSAAWLGRFPLEHPVGAGITSQLGELGQKQQEAALGQYIPAWAEGLIPVGKGAHGLPETVDPFTVTPFDTSAKLAQSLGAALSGHPKLAASTFADELTPAVRALSDLLNHGAPTAVNDLYANTPPALTIGQALGHASKTYPYEGTPLQALLRYLAGTGFVPRETSTDTLERSYQNERRKR